MKRIYILLMACCVMIACKQNEVSFKYSPEAPRAGQPVTFSNLSSAGEEWEWSFGDGGVSTIKSPTHTYKRPGTYRVILKVDGKNSQTATEEIVVYDTIPTFVANDSIFYIFQDYTFTANMYNPYQFPVDYIWMFPINTPYISVVSPTEGWTSQLTAYFTQPLAEAPIWLKMVVDGDTILVQRTFEVRDTTTHSLLIRTAGADYRQRIFGARAENYKIDNSATELLNIAQDTMQTYNGHLFTLSELQSTFPSIEGFFIANRKIYYRADGLWIAALDGTNNVQIDSAPCSALTLSRIDNRIYWANQNGIWYMPLIGSDNNQFVTEPTQLNTLPDVTRLVIDEQAK